MAPQEQSRLDFTDAVELVVPSVAETEFDLLVPLALELIGKVP